MSMVPPETRRTRSASLTWVPRHPPIVALACGRFLPVPIITVCGPGPSAERAHVAVNLAAEAALLGRRTLLVDLDPQCSGTHQLFRPPFAEEPNLESVLTRGGSIEDHARTLRIHVRTWLILSRARTLYVIAGARGLDGRARHDAAARLTLVLKASRERFQLVIADAPGLADPLGYSAVRSSDRVVFAVRAGVAVDHEVRSCTNQATARGVPAKSILHLLIGTEVNQHLGRLARESLDRLVETARRESRPIGRVLRTVIRHDVGLLATYGFEVRRRSDWVDLAAEIVADCEHG
jgi:cellulose biosynthesis protein BcsQ